MKQVSSFLFFVCVILSYANAYNYQTMYSHRTAFFSENNQVLPIRIDSVKMSGDSVFYPIRNIEMLDNNCFDPKGASWIGKKVIVNRDWNYFFNAHNDTIKLKTSASLNESWDVHSSPEMLIKGTVIGIDTVHFLGLIDSVKTIELKAYTITLNALPHKLDNKRIRISKHYGFIDAMNFNSWPAYQFTYIQGDIFQPILAGMTNPEIGIQNLTWFKVFDFQPGDEIHSEYNSGWAFGSPPPYFTINKKTIKKYISRTDYTDSIQYAVDIQSATVEYIQGSYIPTIFHYTTTETIKLNTEFDKLAGEPIIDDYSAGLNTQLYSTFQVKIAPHATENVFERDDSNCWSRMILDGCFPMNSYYTGLGGPYIECTGWMLSYESNSLVYYKKGSETWGTPLVIIKLDQTEMIPLISVYPNPTTDLISFEVNEDTEVRITDLNGKLLINKLINRFDNSISLAVIADGLYIYNIIRAGVKLQTGKISKQ